MFQVRAFGLALCCPTLARLVTHNRPKAVSSWVGAMPRRQVWVLMLLLLPTQATTMPTLLVLVLLCVLLDVTVLLQCGSVHSCPN